jgi:hypothetical protein
MLVSTFQYEPYRECTTDLSTWRLMVVHWYMKDYTPVYCIIGAGKDYEDLVMNFRHPSALNKSADMVLQPHTWESSSCDD